MTILIVHFLSSVELFPHHARATDSLGRVPISTPSIVTVSNLLVGSASKNSGLIVYGTSRIRSFKLYDPSGAINSGCNTAVPESITTASTPIPELLYFKNSLTPKNHALLN